MLDLNNLNSQLDNIKNLDSSQLSKAFSDNQNNIIKIVLVLGSLYFAWWIFNDYRAKDQAVHTKITQLQQKLDVAKTRDSSLQDLNNFKASLPEKFNEFELINLISDFAKSYHVVIITLSPAESQDMGLYDLININFNAVADNFRDLMLFLRNIEKSKLPLRVNSWTGREDADGKVTFEIQISAVIIHK